MVFWKIQWYLGIYSGILAYTVVFWGNTVVSWASRVVFRANYVVFWAKTEVFLGKFRSIFGQVQKYFWQIGVFWPRAVDLNIFTEYMGLTPITELVQYWDGTSSNQRPVCWQLYQKPLCTQQHPVYFREYLATPIQHRSLQKWGALTRGAERQRNSSFSVHLVSVWRDGAAPPWRFCRSAHVQTQAPRRWELLLPKGAAEFFWKYTGW